jgi:acyl carrier protein
MREAELAVLEQIRRIAREELGIEREPAPDDELVRDLGLDSVTLIQLAVAVEDHFRVALLDPDATRARTVRDVVALVIDARAHSPRVTP